MRGRGTVGMFRVSGMFFGCKLHCWCWKGPWVASIRVGSGPYGSAYEISYSKFSKELFLI